MIRQNYILLLLLAAVTVLNIPFTPYYDLLSCDTETYRYVALVMKKGGVPYRDVFDHKPPLIYFISYTGLFFGGWLQWFVNTLLAMVATFLFFRLCRRYRLPYPWLLPLLFNLMLRDFLICGTGGNTREYTAVLTLIFFCVLMGEQRWRYYLLGFLAGLIFFFQQDQVFALIPFFIYSFIRREDNVSLRHRILDPAAGALLATAPIILYFALNHSLVPFWRDAFGFNFGWYTTAIKSSFGDHLRRVKQVLDAGNYEVPFLVAVVLGISALVFRSNNKRLILASLAAVVLSIIPEFMGGRGYGPNGNFPHYFLPLSASVCILLFLVFVFTEEPFLQGKRAMSVFGVLVCISVGYTSLQHITHMTPRKEDSVVASPALDYLRQHPPVDYQLFEFGDHKYLCANNEFKALAPSEWVYGFWRIYKDWDKDHAILLSIQENLLRHRTTYVIDCTRIPALQYKEPVTGIWHAFLEKYYQPVLTDTTGVTLWRWKP